MLFSVNLIQSLKIQNNKQENFENKTIIEYTKPIDTSLSGFFIFHAKQESSEKLVYHCKAKTCISVGIINGKYVILEILNQKDVNQDLDNTISKYIWQVRRIVGKTKKVVYSIKFHSKKYSILKLIGQGTYGKYYSVKNKTNQKEFAVKTFEKSLLILPSDKIALAKQLEIARLFDHPNLLQFYESFESKQFIFVVFKLLLGLLLGGICDKKQKNRKLVTFNNIRQLLVALDHMHSLGVIHRDIKLENIMFRNKEELVLTDFGLAQYLFTNYETPGYCDPELLQNNAGIVLFQMLIGENPFDSDYYNKRVKLNKQGLIDWSILNINGDYLDFLQSLLSRNPFHRFTATQQALNQKIFNQDYGRYQRSGGSNTLISTGSQLTSSNTKQLQIIPSPFQSPKINSLCQFEFDELDNLILEQSKKDKSIVNYPMLERRNNQQFQFNQKLQHRTTKSEVLLFFQV